MRLAPTLLLAGFVGCNEPSIELTGQWAGTAHLVVDGEPKDVALRWEVTQSEGALSGTIVWGDHRRDITIASVEGPEVRIESSTTNDSITFNGLFRKDTIEGRFAIKYSIDPEPFPGRFSVTRLH